LLEVRLVLRRSDVEEGAGRRGDRDAVLSRDLVAWELADAADADARTPTVSRDNGYVHRSGTGWVREELPERGRASVTQYSARAARQDGGHLPRVGRCDRPDEINPAVDASKPPRGHAAIDRVRAKAGSEELVVGDNAVLAPHEVSHPGPRLAP
jgi:hypothetical protein